jgi:hypothetical protein
MLNRFGNFSVERLMDFLIALGLAPPSREDCKIVMPDSGARPDDPGAILMQQVYGADELW